MGATRRRTKSCSDSTHDPNCPHLGERTVAREPVGDKDDSVVGERTLVWASVPGMSPERAPRTGALHNVRVAEAPCM
jgi:hypothetical protein